MCEQFENGMLSGIWFGFGSQTIEERFVGTDMDGICFGIRVYESPTSGIWTFKERYLGSGNAIDN